MLKYRVAIWGLVALAASKEWYEFCSNDFCHRLGPFAWMSFYTAAIEVLVVAKNSHDMFYEPFPWYVKLIWSTIGTIWCCLFYISWRNSENSANQ